MSHRYRQCHQISSFNEDFQRQDNSLLIFFCFFLLSIEIATGGAICQTDSRSALLQAVSAFECFFHRGFYSAYFSVFFCDDSRCDFSVSYT